MARQIQQDPCKAATKDQSFNLVYNESIFRQDYTATKCSFPIYSALFDRIVSFFKTFKKGNKKKKQYCSTLYLLMFNFDHKQVYRD